MIVRGRLKSEQWSEFAEQMKRVRSQLFGLMNTSRQVGGDVQIGLLSDSIADFDDWRFLMYAEAVLDGISDRDAVQMFFGPMMVPHALDSEDVS